MNLRLVAEKLSAVATRRIGIHWGRAIPFTYVAEFPKSGGTWLARMVGDYLQLPFPQYSVLPVAFPCVIQTFDRHHPRLERVLYVVRDGRDVMTSLYYDRLRIARHARRPGSRRLKRIYDGLFGADYDPADVVRHMPRFIEFEFRNPGRGSPVAWHDHVADWTMPARPGVVSVRYEDLLEDCAGTLGRALEELTGDDVDPWRLETTVEKMSMARQTGRRPGQADLTQHIRKGVAGDWRNHFSAEAARIFDHFAGDMLVHLGYEPDRRWLERYDLPSP